MKSKLIGLNVCALSLVAAITLYAAEGNNYVKETSYNRNACKSTSESNCRSEGACNIVKTEHYDCDGENTDTCAPYNNTLNVAGTCVWVKLSDGGFGCNCF
jgi:hypothetical protein